jgi:hypothetical protein
MALTDLWTTYTNLCATKVNLQEELTTTTDLTTMQSLISQIDSLGDFMTPGTQICSVYQQIQAFTNQNME